MSRRIVHTDKAPSALGPYSQAVVAAGVVYCSGQIAIDPAVGEVVSGGVEAETHQVFANLAAVLAEAGSSLASALRCTVFLKDMGDFAKVNAVYAEYFPGDSPPARATVQVSCLPKNVAVEIDCIALVN
ncbi:MAG: 2-iminobutanoate/2-iminopropanoate deaminase [Planctomycetota bacterium]|jgi:2-iminobutanoate/2-iminopropanoate deaminase